MFYLRFLPLVFALVVYIKPLQAQVVQVLDKADLRPVAGALIGLGSAKTIGTGSRGEADLSELLSLKGDTLYITHVAYQPLQLSRTQLQRLNYRILLNERVVNLPEMVFSVSKIEEVATMVPNQIEFIKARQIAFQNPQTSADLLRQSGKVFVQTSQMGGGSPVLRGFEANKVLLVIDGVRMNNAIYRGGHLQNAITVDPNMLDRVEVVFGPGSVIYGSDALGGVMHFFTRNPQLAHDEKVRIEGSAFARYASANQEQTGSAWLSMGFKKWGTFSSFTYKDMADLQAGSHRPRNYPNIWKRDFYADVVNGRDTIMPNSNVNLQRFSGYSQYDITQKVIYRPHDDNLFSLNVQYSNSSDIPRYDRLSKITPAGQPRFATWAYGPQERLFVSLKAAFTGETEFYDQAAAVLGYQRINEERITRRFGNPLEVRREEQVSVYSLNIDMNKKLWQGSLFNYGLEILNNGVESQAQSLHIGTGIRDAADTRYPDGGSEMQSFAVYVQHNREFGAGRWNFAQGIRYSYVTLSAVFEEKRFFPFPFEEVIQRNNAFNANLSLTYRPMPAWKLALTGSSGFRAPNVDDLGKVFDSQPGAVVVPSPDLRPEYVYNIDFNASVIKGDWLQADFTAFYTYFTNAVVTRPARFNGQDSLIYDGVMSQVLASTNASRALLSGLSAAARVRLLPVLSLSGSLNYTRGRVLDERVPLDHIPPLFGQVSLRGDFWRWKSEFFTTFNGWKRLADYAPTSEDNLVYATPDGMPAWFTLNWRNSFQINSYMQLQLSAENILDRHYRYFASGISAPGRNVIVALRANF